MATACPASQQELRGQAPRSGVYSGVDMDDEGVAALLS